MTIEIPMGDSFTQWFFYAQKHTSLWYHIRKIPQTFSIKILHSKSRTKQNKQRTEIPLPKSSSVRVSRPFLEESDMSESCRWVGEDTLDDRPERMPLVSSEGLSSAASLLRRSVPPADNWLIPESYLMVKTNVNGCLENANKFQS